MTSSEACPHKRFGERFAFVEGFFVFFGRIGIVHNTGAGLKITFVFLNMFFMVLRY